MQKNQKSFTHVFLLIVLLVVTLGGISFAGYTLYQSRQKPVEPATTKTEVPVVTEPSDGPEIEEPVDTTLEWKTYKTKAGKYTLKHPDNWYADTCDQTSPDLVLYLGTSKPGRVICNSEHVSQIMIMSTPAVPTESEQELGEEYSNKTSKKVKVDGVTGVRTSGKLKAAEFGAPAGTLLVRYFFLAPGRSYIANYIQTPTGDYKANNLEEFDLLVQKTWDFTK